MTDMAKQVYKKSAVSVILSAAAPLIFTLTVIAIISAGLTQADRAGRAEGAKLLEEAVKRAAVHSYAVEGYFPQSLEHITENYGVYVDTERYVVHYDVFAENMLPDIRVFELFD